MFEIIGMTGFARSGKDTSGKYFNEQGFTRVAFADPIIEIVLKIRPDLIREVETYGWEEVKKDPEVRRLMQIIGTEIGRDIFGQHCWINLANKRIKENGLKKVIITDVRFENEVEYIKNNGGKIIKIKRNGVESLNSHKSEKGIPDEMCDIVIENNGSKEELWDALGSYYETITNCVTS